MSIQNSTAVLSNLAGVTAHMGRTISMRAVPTTLRSHPARHLILAYRLGWQSIDDLNEIAGHVRDIDPSIGTSIVPALSRNVVSQRAAAARPTLVISASALGSFRPLRGRICQGAAIPKIDELGMLERAGVTVPRSAILTPDLRLDPDEWGELVVVKPTDIPRSSRGAGIRLMRTKRVRFAAPSEYPPDHPGRFGPMMVQQFIDTGPAISSYRVLTFFGEPLYAVCEESLSGRVPLTASDDEIEGAPIAIQAAPETRDRFIEYTDVLALARRAHAAIPGVPLKGCDIVREAATGRLFVIELNCGGNTWHFSSDHLAATRAKNGPAFELRRRQQFDAMRTAARVAVERTNAEAE
jgi:hypothetical protein